MKAQELLAEILGKLRTVKDDKKSLKKILVVFQDEILSEEIVILHFTNQQ